MAASNNPANLRMAQGCAPESTSAREWGLGPGACAWRHPPNVKRPAGNLGDALMRMGSFDANQLADLSGGCSARWVARDTEVRLPLASLPRSTFRRWRALFVENVAAPNLELFAHNAIGTNFKRRSS